MRILVSVMLINKKDRSVKPKQIKKRVCILSTNLQTDKLIIRRLKTRENFFLLHPWRTTAVKQLKIK